MYFYLLIFLYASLFYVIIPGFGAVSVRRRWRGFRQTLVNSLQFPLYNPERNQLESGAQREFRYFGTLEALQDNDLLWLRQGQTSVSVNLKGESVFMLPADTSLDLDSPYNGTVQKMRWSKTGILAEGIGVFVCGSLAIESGMPRFKRQAGKEFLIIFFDGLPSSLLPRALWHGRQQNEYWNDFTPFSLLTGFVALLSLAVIGFQEQSLRYAAVWSAAFSLLPFLPLVPPGILFFFGYRYLWRRGRALRARQDLVSIGYQLADSPEIKRECEYAANQVDYFQAQSEMANAKEFKLDISLYHFGHRSEKSGVAFTARYGRDPMAFPLLVQGEPLKRIKQNKNFILFFELAALGIFGLGMLLNLYLTLTFIIRLINSAWLYPA